MLRSYRVTLFYGVGQHTTARHVGTSQPFEKKIEINQTSSGNFPNTFGGGEVKFSPCGCVVNVKVGVCVQAVEPLLQTASGPAKTRAAF